MSTVVRGLLAGAAACIAATAPVAAVGPLDGEVGAFYWANTHEVATSAGSGSADGDAPGFRAELWMFDKYGVRAGQFTSDADELGTDGADYTSVDLMWRALNPTPHNYVAFGLGWQTMELDSVGLDGDTSGVRVSAEGSFGLPGPFAAYGLASYLPALDDAPAVEPTDGTFEDVQGFEYELGFRWSVAPFVSVRAGYRVHSVDFTQNMTGVAPTAAGSGNSGDQGGGLVGLAMNPPPEMECACSAAVTSYSGSAESNGFFAGLGLRF